MIGAVPAARVIHSSLQVTAFANSEEWHQYRVLFG
jgi:hypothetical protein